MVSGFVVVAATKALNSALELDSTGTGTGRTGSAAGKVDLDLSTLPPVNPHSNQCQSIHIPINGFHTTFNEGLIGAAEAFTSKEGAVRFGRAEGTGVRSGNDLVTILH